MLVHSPPHILESANYMFTKHCALWCSAANGTLLSTCLRKVATFSTYSCALYSVGHALSHTFKEECLCSAILLYKRVLLQKEATAKHLVILMQ